MQSQQLKDAFCNLYATIAGSTVFLNLAAFSLYGAFHAIYQYFAVLGEMKALVSPLNITCYDSTPSPWAMAPHNRYNDARANQSGFSNTTACNDLFQQVSFFTSSMLFLGVMGLACLSLGIVLVFSLKKQLAHINDLKRRESSLLSQSIFVGPPGVQNTSIAATDTKLSFNA